VLTAEQVMNGLGKHSARLETNEQVTLRTVSSHNLFTFGSAFTVHVKQYLAQLYSLCRLGKIHSP
jgi:hypothetical protein